MKLRALAESAFIGVLVGTVVVVATAFSGEEYQARVSLLAGPQGPQYGEVVALSLPALVEVARSPAVVAKAGTSAERVSVELVPASGLARLSVRAPAAGQASNEAAAVAAAVVESDLLAPAGTLRVLDAPAVARVAPDWPLATGLALVAAVVAAVAVAAVRHVRGTRVIDGVRAALASAGVRHPVAVVPDDDPALVERLTVLCATARRPVRVVPVVPELAGRAEELAEALPDKVAEPADGVALVAVVPRDGGREELASVVGARPADTTVVAVVLA